MWSKKYLVKKNWPKIFFFQKRIYKNKCWYKKSFVRKELSLGNCGKKTVGPKKFMVKNICQNKSSLCSGSCDDCYTNKHP